MKLASIEIFGLPYKDEFIFDDMGLALQLISLIISLGDGDGTLNITHF